jgi:hypothetical protein
MTDPTSGPVPRCPWCSAALQSPGDEQCPSCGAQLVTASGTDSEIKGVTTLDAEAILRARSESSRPRGRFLSLITGDEEEAASAREHQESLAQPSDEVRREMARLEMEARRSAEEAERTALRAAAMAQLGITVDDLAAAEAAAMAGHQADEHAPAPDEIAAGEIAPGDSAPDDSAPGDSAPDDSAPGDGDEHETWPAELHPADEEPAREPAEESPGP